MPDDGDVRTVALAVVRRRTDGALLLGIGTDPATRRQFCRPVGGGIEEGETPAEAVRREYVEEVGVELDDVRPLAVLDNDYVYGGEKRREVAHLFTARLQDSAMEARAEFPVEKKSLPRIARWFRPEHLGPEAAHVVPEGLWDRLRPVRHVSGPVRCIAVDWSGALKGARRRIALAEAADGRVRRVETGRDRDEVVEHLVEEAARDPNLVVGLDFAFSFPRWFLAERGFDGATALWDAAAKEGEEWLPCRRPPFWGRPGAKRPSLPAHFRGTDESVPAVEGTRPKSPFQVGGAGAVGTGSVRGMPYLARLLAAGFSIWPFNPLRLPAVVEIYPRTLTGPVRKSRQEDREEYLRRIHPDLPADIRGRAAASEDAFDAAVSALAMDLHRAELLSLPPAADAGERLEGRIWTPWTEPQPRR